MAQMAKSMIEVEINVSADKIFQAIKSTRSVPKLSPEKILSVEEQIGDDSKGTKNWTLSVGTKTITSFVSSYYIYKLLYVSN